MVPRISRAGRSFTGAWAYYGHDKRDAAQVARGESLHTTERVAWHHVENMAGIEDARAAFGLMIDTARLSRRCEKPVYAFSLAWHPEQEPSQAHMIEAGRAALQALGMADYQAVFVAHNDTAHRHVHVIVNRVHPATGKAINLYQDQKKLQAWALRYEREQGKLYCRAREFNALARLMAQKRPDLPAPGRDLPAPGRYVEHAIAECWRRSDGGRSFQSALEAKGWRLAKGDRKEAVLMAVAPNGKALAVLRELNQGLPQGQKITNAAFDQRTADLKRDALPHVAQVQAAIQAAGPRLAQEQAQEPERAGPKAPVSAREAFRALGASLAQQVASPRNERRERFEEWAARERQRLFSRQLEARDTLHLMHDHIRTVWTNRVGEPCDRRQREASAEMRAIEERQAQTGLKGWAYRISGRAETDREELDALRVRKHQLAREKDAAREAMEAPLRAENEALKVRQEGELQQLEQQLAERWEQSWSRLQDRANENPRKPERTRKEERSSGGRGARSRSRDYD